MRARSLVRRAVLGTVLAELLSMLLLAAIAVTHERGVRLRAMSVMLDGRVDSLFGAIQDAEDEADSVELDPREIRIPRGDVYAVYDADGRRIGASAGAPGELVGLRAGSGLTTERVAGHSYRRLQRGYLRLIDKDESATGGLQRPVTIVYATELDHIWREIFEAIEFYLGVSLLLMVGTTVGLALFLRRVLRPIAALATAAGAVSPRRLLFAAPAEAMAVAELRPLAETLTTMVEELRLMFDRQHRFLGDAAHELKTAVAVVRSSLQVMLLRPRSVELYERGLEAAVADNARAEELIRRMLVMARLEEPAGPRRAEADAEGAIRRCVETLAPLLEQAEMRVEVQWGAAMASRMVEASAEDLELVFRNLLVNAVEHSEAGSAIGVRVEAEAGGMRVAVRDEGEGIAPEAQAHIFERFFRADSSRARGTGGAGLGLSIAKAVVDRAGGTLTVESTVGEGTEMTVFLPFAARD